MSIVIENRFKPGDMVDVNVQAASGRTWRQGWVGRIENYRGREGYYIYWMFRAPQPSHVSTGGWQSGSVVRAAVPFCQACGSTELGAFVCSVCGKSTLLEAVR